MGQRNHLQTVQASLQSEHSQLNSETQKLRLQLQMLQESHQEQVKQLLRKPIREKRHCLDIEKRFCKVHGNMRYSHQKCSLHQKIAEDMEKELERTIFSCQHQILIYEKRAQERRMPTLSAKRQPNKLRKENEHIRQILMFSLSPILSQVEILLLMFHVQPTEVQKYQGIPWVTRSFRKEEGHAGRAQGLKVPSRFNSSFLAAGPELSPSWHMCLCLLSIKVILSPG